MEVFYNNKPYRQYEFNLFVNNYGVGAVTWDKDKYGKSHLKYIPYKVRKSDEKRYVVFNRYQYNLDRMIGKTFGDYRGFRANDGRSWEIRYVDGNPGHCCQSNLEWVLRQHSVDVSTGLKKMELYLDEYEDVTVYETGAVHISGKAVTPVTCAGDSDTDLFWAADPFTTIGRGAHPDRYTFDELMCLANFVDGDPSLYTHPAVLHKDNNYMNFSADNLEYCDESDPRYIEYEKKKRYEMDDIEERENHGILFRTLKPRWE